MNKLQVFFVLFAIFHVSTCGKLPFIVGGIPANIADHPHQLALLDLVRGVQGNYMCGASNIHRHFALTAAHCVAFGTAPTMVQLYGGSTSRLTGGHIFFVERYVLHPSYSGATLDFDIAIIETVAGSPLDGWDHVSPIRLPPSCTATCCAASCPAGEAAVVAGWGRTSNANNILPEMLWQVTKPLMAHATCQSYYTRTITPRMLCTIIEDGRDSCNGDSGSALTRVVDGELRQVGIVSFGSSVCGDGSIPAVYVRLEDHQVRSWIDSFVQLD